MARGELYLRRLQQGITTLPPNAKRIRIAIGSYLTRVRQHARGNLVIRARYLAQFLGFSRNNWPRAIDRLFSMKRGAAQDLANRFRSWLRNRNYIRPYRWNTFNFISLSRTLKGSGVIRWQLKYQHTQRMEKQWKECPPEFRTEVEAFMRHEGTRSLTSHSMKRIRNHLTLLGRFLGHNKLGFDCLTYEDALRWIEWVKSLGYVPSGMNSRLYLVKRFYNWLRARKVISESPFDLFQPIRVTRKLPVVLTEHETLRVIRAASTHRDRAIMEILYASGCRAGDLCHIDLDKVSFEERTARTIVKGGHESILYLNQSALNAIQSYLKVRGSHTVDQKDTNQKALLLTVLGKRLSTYTVRGIVKECGKRAGLGKTVNPHVLRHSFATHLLNRGADLYSIMRFLGHTSIQSTVRYLQVATARLSEVHRRYHPRK